MKVGDKVRLLGTKSYDKIFTWDDKVRKHHIRKGDIVKVIGIFKHGNDWIDLQQLTGTTIGTFKPCDVELVTETALPGDIGDGLGVNHGSDGIGKDYSKEVFKLEKPETKLELNACKKAKEDAIKKAIEKKAEEYERCVGYFIEAQNKARNAQKEADDYAAKLGITEAEKKELF